MGLKSSWLKSLGLKCHLSRRLKDISTPDFSAPDFSTMNFSIPWFKNSWLKSPGLKGPGLELGVEKSRVEMSFNRFLVKKLKSSRNKKNLNDVTAAPFSVSFFQLPTAK